MLGSSVSKEATAAAMLCAAISGCAVFENFVPLAEVSTTAAAPKKQERAAPKTKRIARVDPKRLVGLDEAGMTRFLGAPESVREQLPARIWTYRVDRCTLVVFFYLDLADQKFRALTYDVSADTKPLGEKAVTRCVGRIRSKHRAQGGV